MPLLSFHEYHQLSYAERCRRIGQLLAKAVRRYYDQQQLVVLETRKPPEHDCDEIERGILRHLADHGACTPIGLSAALSSSPSTIGRRLARLRELGMVRCKGRTKSVRYLLAR